MAIHIVGNLSGGVCSWAACELAAEETDRTPKTLTLLFADTLIEDDDLYRFLVQSAAHIFRVPQPA